jgi:ParB family transcriptional regulator, chromosome partitioning protein
MTTATASKNDSKSDRKTGSEKIPEKLAEKRRALGRGLESLLPGPRAVSPTSAVPQGFRTGNGSELPSSSSLNSPPSAAAQSSAAPDNAGALQPAPLGMTADGDQVFRLRIDQIEDNPHQTRKEFSEEALEELADSIRMQGVLQPIVVRPSHDRPGSAGPGADRPGSEGRFVLILGERRLRASKLAGNTTIPVIVKRVSEQQAAEMTLVENLQRQDLDCLEQAAAFANLSIQFKLTQEEIGKRVGVSREQVSNYLRLLKLPSEALTALRKGLLTYSHARLLLSLHDESQIAKVVEMVIKQKMSVALLEDLVADINIPGGKSPDEQNSGGARWVDPNVRAAQRSLETALGMRVRIRDRKGKGKITIEYGTLEDFDRVVMMLSGK